MVGTASHVPAVTFLRSKNLPSRDSPPVSAVGCPRILPEVHNTVTDRNERLDSLLPRKVLELMIPPITRLGSSVGERLVHGEVPGSMPGLAYLFSSNARTFGKPRLDHQLQEPLLITQIWVGWRCWQRWFFLRITKTFTPISRPSTSHPSYTELQTYMTSRVWPSWNS